MSSIQSRREEGGLLVRRGMPRHRGEDALDASFLAGQDAGTRTAACVARLAALEVMDGARWWNRRRRRLMARTLVACAEELECTAEVRVTACT
jgi:hypothetical protein